MGAERGNHASPPVFSRATYARRSAGSTRKRRPILMYGIFPSQSSERTAHGVALNARAAPWISSKSGSDTGTAGDTTEDLRAINTKPFYEFGVMHLSFSVCSCYRVSCLLQPLEAVNLGDSI